MNLQVSQSTRHAVAKAYAPQVVRTALRSRPQRELRPYESDASYFQRRSREERVFADGLEDPRNRALHLELADRYAALSAAIREAEELLG